MKTINHVVFQHHFDLKTKRRASKSQFSNNQQIDMKWTRFTCIFLALNFAPIHACSISEILGDVSLSSSTVHNMACECDNVL